jgi:hypothetical protein
LTQNLADFPLKLQQLVAFPFPLQIAHLIECFTPEMLAETVMRMPKTWEKIQYSLYIFDILNV